MPDHPNEMGAREIEQFLAHLAVNRNVAASTPNQALSALIFLYREVLHQEFAQSQLIPPTGLALTEPRTTAIH